MKKVVAVVITIIVGYFATVLGAELINWPQLGPVSAVATMGVFILNEIENKKGE
ncbi:MAG: binding-protein-dependent transport permease [Oscillospiraceae bacterium]